MIDPSRDPCELLPWDSAHFGFPIGRVCGNVLTRSSAPAIDRWCAERDVRCLYFLALPDDRPTAVLAEAHRFRFVDVRVDFGRRLDPAGAASAPAPSDSGIREALPEDTERLEWIGSQSFGDTRFYFDTRFPTERTSAMYHIWIRRSLEGAADAVLVTGPPSAPTGFITCQAGKGAEPGRIGLVGVDAESRGAGLGKSLVLAAIEWFRRAGKKSVLVATQARNLPAQRLYQHCGFRTESVGVWYHKWYQ